MALTSGTKLGPYQIVSALGAGGMGEVYRARDTKLGRDVALKVLLGSFTLDAERMGRFEREAKVLAALNHPNIAAIYGFEDSGEAALAMELAEGLTLGERLAKGRMGLEEALPIARQICEGLEYAHERGIVHRDLKPANIKVTPEGTVKLLDFGLARAVQDESTLRDISSSPTFTAMATQAGMILGTAAYMSPEQAKGRATDRRADIWAFGCVFFEMLSGKMAFSGETVTDTLAEVIKTDPDWRSLPAGTPAGIRRLIQRCLKKDVKKRLQAIGDARIAIEEALAGGAADEIQTLASAPVAIRQASRLRRAMPWMAALVAGIAGLATGIALRAPRAAMHFRAVTNLPGVQAEPALSPDGRSVAFVSNRDGYYNIYVSLLAGGKLVQITTGPNVKSRPRWSPDGTTLA